MNTFLHALHCDLEHHINVTGAEMMRVFRELAQMDFSAYDSLVRRRRAERRESKGGGEGRGRRGPRVCVCG